MGRKTLDNEYFAWLYGLVRKPGSGYIMLCKELYSKPFRWFIHNDDNRCEDGINVRYRWIEEMRLDPTHLEVGYFLKKECSVFEVLIALAQRMNDLMYDLNDTGNDKTSRFFFEMIENLGLSSVVDRVTLSVTLSGERLEPVTEARVDEVLESFLDRTYAVNGQGGLFPLKKQPRKDQSRIEIWYQMMAWIEENYS